MLKIYINNEEVVANNDFTINKHMLNTPSVILNNVCPKEWKENKDYSSFYHPQDYSKCKIQDETYIPAETGTYTTINGTATIQNVSTSKLQEVLQLDGDTTQSGTPTPTSPQPINVVSGRQEVVVAGKNLLNVKDGTYSYSTVSWSVENHIVSLSSSDSSYQGGSLQLTKGIAGRWADKSDNHITTNGGTYTLSLNKSGTITYNNGFVDFYCFIYKDDGTNRNEQIVIRNNDNSFTKTITLASDEHIGEITLYSQFIQCENVEFKIMLEKGNQATTYEAYKGQSYEINLGKNLFNKANITSITNGTIENDVITSNAISSNYGGVSSTISGLTLEAGTYYISLKVKRDSGTSGNKLTRITLVGIDSSQIAMVDNPNITNEYQIYSCRISPATQITLTNIGIQLQPTNVNAVMSYTDIMISKDSDTSYSSYKTPIELCKIGNYQDFIKKGTGKNLCDEVNTLNMYFDVGSGTLKSNNDCRIVYAKVNKNTNITVSKTNATNRFRIGLSNEIPQLNSTFVKSSYWQDNVSTLSATINTGDYEYVIVQYTNAGETTKIMINEGSTPLPYEPYGMYNKWYIEKQIGKVVLNGSETYSLNTEGFTITQSNWNNLTNDNCMSKSILLSNYYKNYTTYADLVAQNYGIGIIYSGAKNLYIRNTDITSVANFKTWLSNNNVSLYYILATPTYTEITDSELISQLNSIELIEGLNNISITSPYLTAPIYIHYNFVNAETIIDLLFCGVVKNSGKISLNPREPHLTTLQILDFKDFLSSGELDGFVIYQKTILEAIQMVIGNIQDYGFVLGNVNILNPNEVIGAYSTKDKTAYDVFNYLADITQSRWTTRLIDENTVAIDFYDPTLMVEGTAIDYTQSYFENNLIDNMSYNYGSNNYRNKQVMTSNQVYSNISQAQTMVANGYQTQFPTEQPIGKINSIIVDNIPMSFATFNEKDMGYVADFYYQPGDNYIESDNVLTVGQTIIIEYISIVEGRQIITNPLEIDRIEESTGRKGIVSRYETRNDATTSVELQKIGESYIKYKGTPEITITIDSRKNLWEVGQRVEFNAPIEELETEYMVRTKKINYIVSADTLFYTYELVSSFNSETEINYFDNQRAKSKGNIGEGEYISRNIDIESTANIIFYDTETTEVQVDGDNELNSILNSPFIS